MVLPLLLGGLGRVGLSAVTSTLSGLGMGFGYGFGVRAGYNAYNPNKSDAINKQILSLNPVEAGNGMGRDVASQQFGATDEPSLGTQTSKILDNGGSNITMVHSPYENIGVKPRRMADFKSHEEYLRFKNGEDEATQRILKAYNYRHRLNQKLYNKTKHRR